MCHLLVICVTQYNRCAVAADRGMYMWHVPVDDERCGLPLFYYMDSTHLSPNGVGRTVCLYIDCR